MVELFQTTKQNVSLHINNVFKEGELQENSVVKEYLTTASDGKKYRTKYYNLDVIISVGYRVKSHRGTQFRIWATQKLKEFIVKGFVLDDERLKETGITNQYFEELFERIRDIRSSEKIFYAKIRDIYATAYDYDKDNPINIDFFKKVQNMMHWANYTKPPSKLVNIKRFFFLCFSSKKYSVAMAMQYFFSSIKEKIIHFLKYNFESGLVS